jgi:septal ring factor EnvC (AmiA/AmiB activator)
MTAPLSAQRVEELREHLMFLGAEGISCSKQPCPYCADLLDILSAYEKMRADWDKIPELRADKIRYKIRAEKAEAQLEQVNEALNKTLQQVTNLDGQIDHLEAQLEKQNGTIKLWQDRADELDKECREQFAQLAKQAPLIEAAMTIDELDIQMGLALGMPAAIGATAFAALKYREGESK